MSASTQRDSGSTPPADPSVAVLSLRRARLVPWVCGIIEAEDALVECLGATRLDVVYRHPRLAKAPFSARSSQRLFSLSSKTRLYTIEPKPEKRSELLIVLVSDLHDLAIATGLPGWDQLADQVLVHISEVSERHLHIYSDVVRKLTQRADFVFVGSDIVPVERFRRERVQAVGTVISLIDTLRFPYRSHSDRQIDVLSFGRRSERQHQLLRSWAKDTGGFYLHDTGNQLSVWDMHDHRARFVDVATRSRVIVTNYARFDQPRNTGGLRVLGTRFLEAAAAGSVLCGERPGDPSSYQGVADGLEIVPFGLEARHLPDDLAALLGDTCASDHHGRRMRGIALEQLDVAHQWKRMVSLAGLPLAKGVITRIDDLTREAKHIRGY